jgi:hypothetical protein
VAHPFCGFVQKEWGCALPLRSPFVSAHRIDRDVEASSFSAPNSRLTPIFDRSLYTSWIIKRFVLCSRMLPRHPAPGAHLSSLDSAFTQTPPVNPLASAFTKTPGGIPLPRFVIATGARRLRSGATLRHRQLWSGESWLDLRTTQMTVNSVTGYFQQLAHSLPRSFLPRAARGALWFQHFTHSCLALLVFHFRQPQCFQTLAHSLPKNTGGVGGLPLHSPFVFSTFCSVCPYGKLVIPREPRNLLFSLLALRSERGSRHSSLPTATKTAPFLAKTCKKLVFRCKNVSFLVDFRNRGGNFGLTQKPKEPWPTTTH